MGSPCNCLALGYKRSGQTTVTKDELHTHAPTERTVNPSVEH
jgi:hypothetical protein